MDSEARIGEAAAQFFEMLFTDLKPISPLSLLESIPKLVSREDNEMLEALPRKEEVRRVMFDMDGESTPGPDRYTSRFFKFAWQIISEDVFKVVLSFFCGAELPKAITATSIMLIPKVDQPHDFLQFHPINLCNFFNKIFSRVLADRLAAVLPKIISPQQSGSVYGRLILDNFLLVQELMAGIGKRANSGNIALKLNMSIVYNCMSWLFFTIV